MAVDTQAEARARHGIKFDGTINLGHILTMCGTLMAGAGLYMNLDKRIQRQEDLAPVIQSARDISDARFQASLVQITADVKEVKGSVDKLSTAVQVQNAVATVTQSKGTK